MAIGQLAGVAQVDDGAGDRGALVGRVDRVDDGVDHVFAGVGGRRLRLLIGSVGARVIRLGRGSTSERPMSRSSARRFQGSARVWVGRAPISLAAQVRDGRLCFNDLRLKSPDDFRGKSRERDRRVSVARPVISRGCPSRSEGLLGYGSPFW